MSKLADADHRRMMDLLHLAEPAGLPPMADDPKRPENTRPAAASSANWTDDVPGHTIVRSAWGSWSNYDLAKADRYPIPDVLALDGGGEVSDPATWWKIRRPQILAEFQNEIYGRIPENTPKITWEITSTQAGALEGMAILRTIVGHIDNSRYPAATPQIRIALYLPAKANGPVPVMVVASWSTSGKGFGPPSPGPTAMQQVVAHGWGYALVDTYAIQADSGGGLDNGIIGLMNAGKPRQPSDWGALAAWSWGLSRTIDYFETDRNVDSKHLGIEGHSRWGKEALLAAALDPRWAIVFSSCSGEGGAKLHRHDVGESVDNVAGSGEYHWMAGNFLKYAGHWDQLPVDQHELIALVAPRPIFITGGTQDLWSDPVGEFKAAVAAGPVYRLLGRRDLGTTEVPRSGCRAHRGRPRFQVARRGHTDLLDWPTFIRFADKYFPRNASAMTPLPLVSTSTNLGAFEGQTDIGAPKLPGSATYDAATQEYGLSAAGSNMWHNRDEFHFVWRKANGDFILRANISLTGPGLTEHRKLGFMVRPSLDDDAPYADCAEHGDGLTSIQVRRTKGAVSEQIVLPIVHADVIQFERRGNTYIFSAAHEGLPFVSSELPNFALPDDVFVGLFLCSHNADVVENAVFRNVRFIRPAKPNFRPYTDYIGSSLEILDVATGHLRSIYQAAQPFEAPNWTRDGTALIFNLSGREGDHGRLRRFDLATHQPSPIDTDFADRNNNDHVLSFDGTMLGISHHSADHGGGSTIYTLPSTGGKPKQITSLTPSYLHGWSPDGKFLVYTGGRGNKYDIYKIASDGSGQEIRLTNSDGLNDGPEFTPDGRHIYFNSSRTGRMQIWRMDADGANQEQVTIDEYNNWFPHISPDGKWIAIVSFPKDISPDDHPYYKQIYIRLMPIEGGSPKVIAYVYGGQGTMNVPSWSPDGSQLAFVSNSDIP